MAKSTLNPQKALKRELFRVYNGIVRRVYAKAPIDPGILQLREIQQESKIGVAISDHLVTLFAETIAMRPKTIVELGVRRGESTFVFGRVAQLLENTKIISVDLNEFQSKQTYPNWFFVQKDDTVFAKEFVGFCQERGVSPTIDVLFIDTSHHYEHTRQEIQDWFPFLADHAKVLFHDTNMRNVYFRKDHTIGRGWDNQRGVVQAVEEYFGTRFNENQDFVDFRKGWLIKHHANSSGLTILERVIKE